MQLRSRIRQLRHDLLKIPKMLFNIFRLKRRFPQMRIYTYQSLVKSIQKRNDVCHVIATGSSALESYKAGVVQPGDYIIGFNFAAFLPYTFDLYFFEEIFSTSDFYMARTKGITELLHQRKEYMPNLVYKNAKTACPKLIAKFIPDLHFSAVLDRLVTDRRTQKLVAPPSLLMPQCCSTVITAIMLAYHAGFKNIVVHGLDFSGPHIYHDEDLQRQTGMSAPSPYVSKDVKHITADGQEEIWPELMKIFTEKKVNVFCASPSSYFKKYAKIWPRP